MCRKCAEVGIAVIESQHYRFAKALLGLPEVNHWRTEGLEEDEEVGFYDIAPLELVPFEIV